MKRAKRRSLSRLSTTIAALLATASVSHAQDVTMGNRYRQSPEVLARYPDVDLRLDTPALAQGRTTLTTQSELESFLIKLVRPDRPIILQTLTTTQQGRSLPILYLTKDRLIDPAAIRASGRPVVWLIGQQHGNEPAGGEAMLALAHAISDGELRPLLDHLAIVIVPRANPDGASSDTRDTAARLDLNRDHGSMALPETRALHSAIQALPPDLVIDAHEFSVAQRWIEKFGGLQAVDLMLLDATHPMVPEATRDLAARLFQPAIEAAIAARGLSVFPYHTTSTRRSDRNVAMGGNAPGIARNAFGLMGAVSFLFETRGVGIGMESYQRRVATHYIAIKAALETAAANAGRLRDGVAKARADIASRRAEVVVAHQVESDQAALPLVDPATGERRIADVLMSNSRRVTVTAKRPSAAGYVILPEARGGLTELRLLGAAICTVRTAIEVDAEMFEIRDRSLIDRRAINPDASMKTQLRPVRVLIAAGSVYVPMAQSAGHRIAIALEPDQPGSFVAHDIMRVPADRDTVPVVRIPEGVVLDLEPTLEHSLCQSPAR
jgi:Zinc carboxypeptidase